MMSSRTNLKKRSILRLSSRLVLKNRDHEKIYTADMTIELNNDQIDGYFYLDIFAYAKWLNELPSSNTSGRIIV